MPNQKSVHTWSTAANQNNNADASLSLPEGALSAGLVDNRMRQTMAAEKATLIDSSYGTLTTGTGTAFAISLFQVITNPKPGMRFAFTAHANNTGPATFNIGTGPIEMLRHDGSQLVKNDLRKGLLHEVWVDDNGSFRLTNPVPELWTPAVNPLLETVPPDPLYSVSAVAKVPLSDEFNYDRVYKNTGIIVILNGQWQITPKKDEWFSLFELELRYFDEDNEPQLIGNKLTVGVKGYVLEVDNDGDPLANNPLIAGSFSLQVKLDDTHLRTNNSWRVGLYGGKVDNSVEKTLTIPWSNCLFIPTN
jgi:hypothetical protein